LQAPDIEARVEIVHAGPVKDRRLMAILYGAADVFCAPSRMENLANTVLESLACGTPVAAFAIGGMPDMIDHEVNGYLASPFDTTDYCKGIEWSLSQRGREQIRQSCVRKITEGFSLDQEIEGYLRIYQQLCSATRSDAAFEPRPAYS
jgi:glycosyltransferase involved in cell wall biosynthesis